MRYIKKISLVTVYLLCMSLVFSAEKESYLTNEYYAPLVCKIENKLLGNKYIKSVNIYKAANPFPFTPDLFSLEIETLNTHKYVFECIPTDLTFYKSLSRIKSIDGTEYVTLKKRFYNTSSDRGIVLSQLSGIKNLRISTLLDFFEKEDVLYEYFTKPQEVIRHETKSNIQFLKIKNNMVS